MRSLCSLAALLTACGSNEPPPRPIAPAAPIAPVATVATSDAAAEAPNGSGAIDHEDRCEPACRNYASLMFWSQADPEIERAPADQRAGLRRDKAVEFAGKLEAGIDFCTNKCRSANNPAQTKCLSDAITADRARACVDPTP